MIVVCSIAGNFLDGLLKQLDCGVVDALLVVGPGERISGTYSERAFSCS
jgi:hypothetical protein